MTRRSLARRAFAALALCAAVSCATSTAAVTAPGAEVPVPLRAAATRDNARVFDVIVQGRRGSAPAAVAAAVADETAAVPRRRFTMINGVAARMTGGQLLHLAHVPGILAITVDAPVRARDLLAPAVLVPPTISGAAVEGAVVTAVPGSWSGAAPFSYAYAWQACTAGSCTDIAGATTATMLLPPGSAGTAVRVVVTATDATGASAAATSEPVAVTAPAAPAPVPVLPTVVAPPTITGTAEVGIALSSSEGEWNGSGSITLSYKWQRCDTAGGSCVDLAGATAAAYSPTSDDVGSTLRVAVTATNAAGTETAVSGPTPRITPLRRAGRWNWQLWPYAAGVADQWAATATASVPTIAVVDSGVDASLPDLQGRVVRQVTVTSLPENAAGDGRGHGTFVASLAAGAAEGRTGAAPTARIVSLDVLDDHGMGTTSDVLAAADWIYAHRESDGIRVANFSLTGTVGTSFEIDPLDRAIERLWLSGVVVVAAAGNYGTETGPGGVPYAPSNDPLALTVGATDVAGTEPRGDDFTAPWSSYGYTMDGFAKPELAAPGRSIIGPVPAGATIAVEHPERVVEPGLMRLSGTSLAAPIVAGAAANLLALHPGWTPDQVKGALMQSATSLPRAAAQSAGLGAIDASSAAGVSDPANPNAAVERFLVPGPNGSPTPVIDTFAWAAAAAADPAWVSTYWGSTYWGSTYWGSTYWGSTYWGSTTAGATYWGSTYWGSTYWGSTYWGSNANASEGLGPGDGAAPAPPPISPDVVE